MTRADSSRKTNSTLDFYPTPGWATRALFEHVTSIDGIVWEPAAGNGHMAKVLREYGLTVLETDIQTDGLSFLTRNMLDHDWIVTNPPYNLATEFAKHAVINGTGNVALFVRYAFLEGQRRYTELFSQTPPCLIAQFTERVALTEGCTKKSTGSAIPYVWLVWKRQNLRNGLTKFIWIPPCKQKLSKPEDWDEL